MGLFGKKNNQINEQEQLFKNLQKNKANERSWYGLDDVINRPKRKTLAELEKEALDIYNNSSMNEFDRALKDKTWVYYFGESDKRKKEIRSWISQCSHMQMTAACCIGNAYHSINVAFVLANIMENYAGGARQTEFERIAGLVEHIGEGFSSENLLLDAGTFELYYGIHLDEDGSIINLDLRRENEPGDFIGKKVTEEELVGRNYYLYVDGEKSEDQPLQIHINDFNLSLNSEENKDEEDEIVEDDDNYGEYLDEYVDGECWIKRLNACEDGKEGYYLIAITLSVDNTIENINVIYEQVQRTGSNMFLVPGMEMQGVSYYEMLDYYPLEVEKEIAQLMKKRCLGANTSFVNKPVPKALTENNFTCSSAFRLAYNSLLIEANDGVIESIDYKTYQSTGSEYGDMVSRPILIDDREDEAIDMLLNLLDQYDEEEYKTLYCDGWNKINNKNEEEPVLYLEAANGMTVRVPASKVKEWQRKQDELRAKGVTLKVLDDLKNEMKSILQNNQENGINIEKSVFKLAPELENEYPRKGNKENTAASNKTVIDVNEQIEIVKKLKELMDIGVLSKEEFEQKKKEVMGL